ncbi:uncharacterized protein LOC111279973 isoform X2 [Durio zibethinus]|uniref:Uncharacterized protein LOC111279973 isoform X2 n=1 Tax=Durio zibethinus TaxID=66656 RepID=A0A6P5X330_DURZI|nr:uncharacterized protein LOC111279973 isoform X2 [Durio zibethinus]XP_022722800.1 uncharacterized protein LOC111279973 isoform X2 [Durio zibethinus]
MLSSSRVLDIHINDVRYYGNLNVTSEEATIFATRWPLDGPTRITLRTSANSNISPLTNAGESFDVHHLGGRTHTREVCGAFHINGMVILACPLITHGLELHALRWNLTSMDLVLFAL